MSYPGELDAIVSLFEALPDDEKRDNLIVYADQAKRCEPEAGEEQWDIKDVRKDDECTDTVGVFLKVLPDESVRLRVTLGPQVQTLTRAMTSILCQGLKGCTLQEILEAPADFVPKIVGGQLVRVRSQTVYYVLTRIKSACTAYLNRQKIAEAKGE